LGLWQEQEPDVVAYDIYRWTDAGFSPGDAKRLAELKVEETTRRYDHQMFLDTTVVSGTANYHYVRARNAHGKPGSFSTIAAATKPPDNVKPTAPNKPERPQFGDDTIPAVP